jgi:hypothetical protein
VRSCVFANSRVIIIGMPDSGAAAAAAAGRSRKKPQHIIRRRSAPVSRLCRRSRPKSKSLELHVQRLHRCRTSNYFSLQSCVLTECEIPDVRGGIVDEMESVCAQTADYGWGMCMFSWHFLASGVATAFGRYRALME